MKAVPPESSCAAVFRGPGLPLTLERFPLPELRGGEALVRTRCATICGSDLHSYYGRRPAPVPGILGHEMVGEIVRLGPAGARDYHDRPLKLGDRVTWSMVWSCGACFYCALGLPSRCERLRKFGLELLRPGGRLVMAGATFPSRPAQVSAEQCVRRSLAIAGVYNYQPRDLEEALRFLAEAHLQFPFAALVGRTFPLPEVNAAFACAERERHPRVAVCP